MGSWPKIIVLLLGMINGIFKRKNQRDRQEKRADIIADPRHAVNQRFGGVPEHPGTKVLPGKPTNHQSNKLN
jgi:hypothetical protein